MVGGPRTIDEEAGEELVSIKLLKTQLRCAICYEILNDPYTVKSCLHSFCNRCITNQVRNLGMCPSCRMPIGSKRLLRASKNVDQIIKLLLDDINLYNEVHAKKREEKLGKLFDINQFRREIKQQLQR